MLPFNFSRLRIDVQRGVAIETGEIPTSLAFILLLDLYVNHIRFWLSTLWSFVYIKLCHIINLFSKILVYSSSVVIVCSGINFMVLWKSLKLCD